MCYFCKFTRTSGSVQAPLGGSNSPFLVSLAHAWISSCPSCQAGPSHYESATHDVAIGAQSAEAAAESWRESAAGLVRYLREAKLPEGSKKKKSHRRKAFLFLAKVEQQCKAMAGMDLRHFRVDISKEKRPASLWPGLTLTTDQCPDNSSACNYLLAKGVNLVVISDSSHRVWNDVRQSFQGAGLLAMVMATCAVINFDSGPWRSAEFFQQSRDACAELASVQGCENPLVQQMLPALLSELDLAAEAGNPELPSMIMTELGQSFENKFQRVGMCRWFQVLDSAELLLRRWSCGFLVLLYMAHEWGRLYWVQG